ncbi:MAG: outer membrane lipoprotein-sorting protein [Candidatus Eisenbacteria bacterium]
MNSPRRPSSTTLLPLLAALLCFLPVPTPASPTAREILDAVDDLYRGESSRGVMIMTITTAHWTRTLSMDFWSKGKERSLIRITSPKKERGTATLRSDRDMWNYLPKVNRVIKLPSSMLSSSWMGSHFTNDDLVKENRMTEDYDFSVTGEGVLGGDPTVELTCVPKEDAAVVWGKVVFTIRQKDIMPLAVRYFDEDMRLARTLTFSDYRTVGDRLVPVRMEVEPVDDPGESTVVVYDEIEFDVELPDDLFSIRSLQR